MIAVKINKEDRVISHYAKDWKEARRILGLKIEDFADDSSNKNILVDNVKDLRNSSPVDPAIMSKVACSALENSFTVYCVICGVIKEGFSNETKATKEFKREHRDCLLEGESIAEGLFEFVRKEFGWDADRKLLFCVEYHLGFRAFELDPRVMELRYTEDPLLIE